MTKKTITLIILLSVFGYAPISLADLTQSFDWEKSRFTDQEDLKKKIKEVTKYFKTQTEDFSNEVKSYIQKTISQYIAQSVSKKKQDAKSILKAFKQKMLSFSLNNQKYHKKIYALINAIKKYKNNFIKKDYLKDDRCRQYTNDVNLINCVIEQYKEFFKSKYHGSESLIKIPRIERLGKKTLSSVIDQEGLEKTILIMKAFVTQYFIKNNPEINPDIFYVKNNRDILTKMLSDALPLVPVLSFVPNPQNTSTNTIIKQEEITNITNKQQGNSLENISETEEQKESATPIWASIEGLVDQENALTPKEKIYLKRYLRQLSLFYYIFYDQNPEYTKEWIEKNLDKPPFNKAPSLVRSFKELLMTENFTKLLKPNPVITIVLKRVISKLDEEYNYILTRDYDNLKEIPKYINNNDNSIFQKLNDESLFQFLRYLWHVISELKITNFNEYNQTEIDDQINAYKKEYGENPAMGDYDSNPNWDYIENFIQNKKDNLTADEKNHFKDKFPGIALFYSILYAQNKNSGEKWLTEYLDKVIGGGWFSLRKDAKKDATKEKLKTYFEEAREKFFAPNKWIESLIERTLSGLDKKNMDALKQYAQDIVGTDNNTTLKQYAQAIVWKKPHDNNKIILTGQTLWIELKKLLVQIQEFNEKQELDNEGNRLDIEESLSGYIEDDKEYKEFLDAHKNTTSEKFIEEKTNEFITNLEIPENTKIPIFVRAYFENILNIDTLVKNQEKISYLTPIFNDDDGDDQGKSEDATAANTSHSVMQNENITNKQKENSLENISETNKQKESATPIWASIKGLVENEKPLTKTKKDYLESYLGALSLSYYIFYDESPEDTKKWIEKNLDDKVFKKTPSLVKKFKELLMTEDFTKLLKPNPAITNLIIDIMHDLDQIDGKDRIESLKKYKEKFNENGSKALSPDDQDLADFLYDDLWDIISEFEIENFHTLGIQQEINAYKTRYNEQPDVKDIHFNPHWDYVENFIQNKEATSKSGEEKDFLTADEKKYFKDKFPGIALFYSILYAQNKNSGEKWLTEYLDKVIGGGWFYLLKDAKKDAKKDATKEKLKTYFEEARKEFFAPNKWIENLIERTLSALDKKNMAALKKDAQDIVGNKTPDNDKIISTAQTLCLKLKNLLVDMEKFYQSQSIDFEKRLYDDEARYYQEYREELEKEKDKNPNEKPEEIENKFIDDKAQKFIEDIKDYISNDAVIKDSMKAFARAYFENIFYVDNDFLKNNKISYLTPVFNDGDDGDDGDGQGNSEDDHSQSTTANTSYVMQSDALSESQISQQESKENTKTTTEQKQKTSEEQIKKEDAQKENSSESQKIEDPSADNLSWIDIDKFNIKNLIEKTEELTKEEKIYLKKYFTPVSLFNYLFHDKTPEYTEAWIDKNLRNPDKGLIERFKALLTGKPWIKDLITRTILDLYKMDDHMITKDDIKIIKDASLSYVAVESDRAVALKSKRFFSDLASVFSKLFYEIEYINKEYNLDIENKLYTEAQTYRADLEKLIQEKKKENTGITPEEIKKFIDNKASSFIRNNLSKYFTKKGDDYYGTGFRFNTSPSYIPVFIKTYLENILNTDDESLDFIKTDLENILNTDDEVFEKQEIILNESNTSEEQSGNSAGQEPANDPAAEPLARNPHWRKFMLSDETWVDKLKGLTSDEKYYLENNFPKLALSYSLLYDQSFDYTKSWIKRELDSDKISINAQEQILPLFMHFRETFFAPNKWIENLIKRILSAIAKKSMDSVKQYKAGIITDKDDPYLTFADLWLQFMSFLFAIDNFNNDHKLDIEKDLSVYVKNYKKYRKELEEKKKKNPYRKTEDIEREFIDEKIQRFHEKIPQVIKDAFTDDDEYNSYIDYMYYITIFARAYWENILHMDEDFLEKNKISLFTPAPVENYTPNWDYVENFMQTQEDNLTADEKEYFKDKFPGIALFYSILYAISYAKRQNSGEKWLNQYLNSVVVKTKSGTLWGTDINLTPNAKEQLVKYFEKARKKFFAPNQWIKSLIERTLSDLDKDLMGKLKKEVQAILQKKSHDNELIIQTAQTLWEKLKQLLAEIQEVQKKKGLDNEGKNLDIEHSLRYYANDYKKDKESLSENQK